MFIKPESTYIIVHGPGGPLMLGWANRLASSHALRAYILYGTVAIYPITVTDKHHYVE